MRGKKSLTIVVGISAMALVALSTLQAQEQGKPGPQGKEVTLKGKIVDLQCCMTQQFPSSDKVRCTRECIRAGVPAALETEEGLVVIGKGHRGPVQEIARYAFQEVELKGRLYEREGFRYVDLVSVKESPASKMDEESPEDADWTDVEEDEEEDEDW